MQPELREVCRGRWPAILASYRISERALTGKHGPCPNCGGKDRFRFVNDDGYGTYFCSQCGAGDGIDLLQKVTGKDFQTLANELRPAATNYQSSAIPAKPDQEEIRAERRKIWSESKHTQPGDCVRCYLASRGLEAYPVCSDLRLRGQEMVAMVRDPEGNPTTLHRTLFKNGKRDKRLFARGDYAKGSTVQLFPFGGGWLGIAEGIETAISAHFLHNHIPVWAALNANNMAEFVPPESCKRVVIFGDCDASYTGQSVAYALARKLKTKGIEVRVRFPDLSRHGIDWNNLLIERQEKAA